MEQFHSAMRHSITLEQLVSPLNFVMSLNVEISLEPPLQKTKQIVDNLEFKTCLY